MKKIVERAILWFIDKYLRSYIDKSVDEKMKYFHSHFKGYIKDLNAFTASDIHYKGTGFIVMAAKVKNQDFVKVIPLEPFESVTDYRNTCMLLTHKFGARHYHFDSPSRGYFEKDMIKRFCG